jgi:ATP-dependent Clp protease protease subunit
MLDDKLLQHRIVVLDRQITAEVANRLIASLLFLQNEDPEQPIRLLVNSCGGSVADGCAIMDTMDFVSPPVHTHCYGRADSMAAIIVAHGEKSHRSANQFATFSLSDPTAAKPNSLPPLHVSKELTRIRSELCGRIVANTGIPLSEVQELMADSAAFDAFQAQSYNLIDRVVESGLIDPVVDESR